MDNEILKESIRINRDDAGDDNKIKNLKLFTIKALSS